jgi:hypothetical protein
MRSCKCWRRKSLKKLGAQTQSTPGGSKNCPFYYNRERDERSLTGCNRFDPGCRAYLRNHIPETLFQVPRARIIQAFDQLLTTYR